LLTNADFRAGDMDTHFLERRFLPAISAASEHSEDDTALVVAALLYSEGDYGRSICNVVMGGWDTDSNGATAGSILGTMLGAKRLPEKWISPLRNRMRSSLKGFDNSAFEDLAQRTMKQIVSF